MATALRRYYRGHNLVTLREVPTAQSRVYHFDHQGTTQCLTDSTGTVTDRFASDAWGVPVKRTGSSINRQWYVGGFGYYHDQREENYVRARHISLIRGRWLSRDPSGYEPNSAYVRNRAALAVDPSGLITEASAKNRSPKPKSCSIRPDLKVLTALRCYKPSYFPLFWMETQAAKEMYAEGWVWCYYDTAETCECPPTSPFTICQAFWGHDRNKRRYWRNVGIGNWCPDTSLNDPQMGNTVTEGNCNRSRWNYDGPNIQRLVNRSTINNGRTLVCGYRLCMYDTPGYIKIRDIPIQCGPIRRKYGYLGIDIRTMPIFVHMNFRTWICDGSTGKTAPGASYHYWSFDADYVGESRQVCW